MPFLAERSTSLIWIVVVVVVASALAVFQFMRANAPDETQTNRPTAPIYTTGSVVDGVLTIPSNEYRSFRLDFNKRTKVLGTHWTGDSRKRVLAQILPDPEFEKWKAGQEFKPVTQTGYVPRGKIERVMDPGVYYLIYDNRSAEYGGDQKVEASFTVD
jgi:hypothetical protein